MIMPGSVQALDVLAMAVAVGTLVSQRPPARIRT
jgi:hypothetical protein